MNACRLTAARDVVAVTASQDGGQGDAVGLDDDVVFAAGLGAVHRRLPVAGPPFIARRWLESTAVREKSSR
jgi:hypothetical protein